MSRYDSVFKTSSIFNAIIAHLSPKRTTLSAKSPFWDKSKKRLYFFFSGYIHEKFGMELGFWRRILAEFIKLQDLFQKLWFESMIFCPRVCMDLRYFNFNSLDLRYFRYGLKIHLLRVLDLRYFKLDLRYFKIGLKIFLKILCGLKIVIDYQ